ncbi:MAG: Nif11 family protein [Ruminiclostridium sp.]|nr:Nif11 family protein [Ruminiclostridium sp.]
MKTLQELYNEIVGSDALKKQFAEAAKNNAVVDFAKANGVETTLDEIKAFLEEKQKKDAELDPAELENAAGGTCNKKTDDECGISLVGLGIFCAGVAVYSAIAGHVGQENDTEGRLCSEM